MITKSNPVRRFGLLMAFALLASAAACNRGASPAGANDASTKRYAFKGKVVSIDKNAGTANINNEPISGFMNAMTMSYTLKPASVLDQLNPGDSITAEVVVAPDTYWLENVKVAGHSPPTRM